MKFACQINSFPKNLGNGWDLRILNDGEEVWHERFWVPEPSLDELMTWWTSLGSAERAFWRDQSAHHRPAGAYRLHMMEDAFVQAVAVARKWLTDNNFSSP
ncbi:hypothetical protein [Pseudoduganella lutea]|uniref:Uncharacterized protein n=1 Tax=Pseudoduganella lutea TaxID=321985 RepID=A0A4P6L430_9BURK|nr:hypothetical protein [Pseudoduganella lutea]QBE66426.1 hypothetical protein EWM63_28515 [Pseudoduganella lutea]